LDLNDVLIFAAVVHEGSFTKAARRLGLPKSTMSRKVSELEARLRARLLQRTTRSLSLTDAGRVYYDHAQRIAGELDAATAAVGELEAAPRGRLRVSAPLNFGAVGPAVAAFLLRYPDVTVELVGTDRVVDLVEEGFDLALRASRLPDSSLVARPLGSVRSIVVGSPSYLDARGMPKKPRDLTNHDCLVFGAGVDQGTWRLTRDGKEEVIKLRGKLITNDFDILHEAASNGLGLALLSLGRASRDLETGRLRRVLPEHCSPPYPVHAVYPSTRHLSPKVRAFIDFVAKAPGTPWQLDDGAAVKLERSRGRSPRGRSSPSSR